MSQALQALQFARVYLNDINGIQWSDSVLMPFLQLAHRELVEELKINDIEVLNYVTNRITVPNGTLLLPTTPTNIINPISMVEGDVGSDIENFQDMIRVEFLPFEDQVNWLTYWCWIQETIQFLGSTADRQVILRYSGSIAMPQLATDSLGVIFAENFIGPRIVSLAYGSAGKNTSSVDAIAAANLYKIIQNSVKENQRPTRRRSYRSSKGFYSPARL